jgi:hypothetical protein
MTTPEDIDRRYYSRKFRLAVGVTVLAWSFYAGAAFWMPGTFSTADLLSFTRWVVGLYMAGNVGDTLAEAVKTAKAS